MSHNPNPIHPPDVDPRARALTVTPDVAQALHDLLDFLMLDHPEVIEHSKLLKDAATTVLEWSHGKTAEVTR